jgi:hypothetical protein
LSLEERLRDLERRVAALEAKRTYRLDELEVADPATGKRYRLVPSFGLVELRAADGRKFYRLLLEEVS